MRGHCIYFLEELWVIWWGIVVENFGGRRKTLEREKPPIRQSALPGLLDRRAGNVGVLSDGETNYAGLISEKMPRFGLMSFFGMRGKRISRAAFAADVGENVAVFYAGCQT